MVVLFSIDGMRPDGLRLAKTPNLDRLRENGIWTDKARTVMPSCTLPCHTSMMRGVDVPRHGINTNQFHPLVRPVPSIFDVASQQGKRCGMFYNWGHLRDLCDPESVEISFYEHSQWLDNRIAEEAAKSIRRDRFDFVFVYLGYTDEIGHVQGWMSDAYLKGIENADRCVGQVLEDLDPTVIVMSDHGGHDRSHGTDMPEDMTIPFILSGPGSPARNEEIQKEVRIFDTAPTIASLLGLALPREWDGKSVI